MLSVHKILSYRQKSEGGFVLIAALMAVMILMAVGFFILTTTSQDLRMSSRLVGERKAFSAAESGMQTFCLTFSSDPAQYPKSDQPVDATNDPTARFDIPNAPARNATDMAAVGSDIKGGVHWGYQIWTADIIGRDTAYKSSVTLSVGFQFGPVPDDPAYH